MLAGLKESNHSSVHYAALPLFTLPFLLKQTGEYATDDEETGTTGTGGEKSIEVFDLPETEEIMSPSELDATKLYQKFREVTSRAVLTPEYPKVKITQLMGAHCIFSVSALKNKLQIYPHAHTLKKKKVIQFNNKRYKHNRAPLALLGRVVFFCKDLRSTYPL